MSRLLVIAAISVLLGPSVSIAAPSDQPSCILIGWLDAIRLGSGSALTTDQRREWMAQLVSGVDISDILQTIKSTMPPTEAAQIAALVSDAWSVSHGNSSRLEPDELGRIAKFLPAIPCEDDPELSGGAAQMGAGGLLGSPSESRRAPYEADLQEPFSGDATVYSGLLALVTCTVALALVWSRRKERRARRFVCVLSVSIRIDEMEWQGKMLDVSQGGCRLQSDIRLPPGKTAKVFAGPFSAEGRIVWSGGGHGGIAFAQILSTESLLELRNLASQKRRTVFRGPQKLKEA